MTASSKRWQTTDWWSLNLKQYLFHIHIRISIKSCKVFVHSRKTYYKLIMKFCNIVISKNAKLVKPLGTLCICLGIFVFAFVSVYLSLSTWTIGSGVQGWQACPHNVSLPRCRETRSDCSKKWRHKSWAGAQKGWSGCNIIPTLGDTACSTGGADPSRSKCLRFSPLLLHIFLYNRLI